MYRNIEAERARKGYTKERIASDLGASPKTYYNWVYGITPIPSHKLLKMSQIFGVSIDYLLETKS